MSEPKRWLDQGAPRDLERLVRAAQAEHPDAASLGRTLAAVGVGLGATSVAAGASAGTAAGVGGTAKVTLPLTGSLFAKWTALGVTVATLAVGAATVATEAPPTARAPATSVVLTARPLAGATQATAQPLMAPPDAGEVTPHAPPANTSPDATPVASTADRPREATKTPPAAPRPTAPADVPASGAPLDAETLAAEVQSIDRARAALATGQATQTLAVLDEYERRFRHRGFAPEALYLRMEAWTALGRTAEARAAAERLLASYPNSLHGTRARAVLSKNP
jgi:hypothetical protein